MSDAQNVLPAQASTPPRLSKSKFLSGLQCHKRLYLEIYQPQLATPPDAGTQAILDMGTEIGELARKRFAGGVLVTAGYKQREAALAQTAALLLDPNVPAIFEAAVQHDGVLVRVDILERVQPEEGPPSCWRLIEVKSSTRVKDVHADDLAVQTHVLSGAGLTLAATCLMHIDTGYLYEGGDVDLLQLFSIEDLTEVVAGRRTQVAEQLAAMKAMLRESAPPVIEPDQHCHSPYECPFWAHCTKEKPARWIYHLPGAKQTVTRLMQQGITTIDDIPEGTTLSLAQRRVKDNVEWVSPKLGSVLRSIQYPVHHVDFETVMLAVPRFPSTRPYQSIPVQWSNHIELESGELIHQEFLHSEASDPRKWWAEALIESLGEKGSIVVYSAYEEAMIKQLLEAFPEYRSVFKPILTRLWDLHPVIKEHYYHPAFHGSYSIKSVLPAVVPSMGYDDLVIKEGGQAASEYYRMVFVEADWIEQATIKEALLRYCARDTMAMVELRRVLRSKVISTAHDPAERASFP
jgi:predicted RecB family nuclease